MLYGRQVPLTAARDWAVLTHDRLIFAIWALNLFV